MKVKMIFCVNSFGSREPGHQGHGNHQQLLNSPRPTEIAARNRRRHDASQKKEVSLSLDMQPAARLNVFSQCSRSFYILAYEYVLVVEIENKQHNANRHNPNREQTQSPLEWDAAKKAEKERWIAKRRQ